MKKISPIIESIELLTLYQNPNIIIVDVSNGKNSKENYANKHIDKAVFVDLNLELAAIKEDFADGGRHPLPTIDLFSATLSKLGITKNSHVIIYDDKNGSNAAARFWWMLKSAGHEKVQVLNGGIQQAEKIGIPVNNKIVTITEVARYIIDKWILPLANIDEVELKSQHSDCIVIDVRENNRYKGEVEPIDLIAGHIPGAINVPFSINLNEEGLFLAPNKLKAIYQSVLGVKKSDNVIVHCGSGVTACHTLLAMDYAGIALPKLYVGSWSEWSRNDKKISTGI